MSDKNKKIVDVVFLAALAVLIAILFYEHRVDNFVLYTNNYLAVILWVVIVLYKLLNPEKAKWLLFVVLFFAVFQVVNFSVGSSAFGIKNSKGDFTYIGFDPLLFLLFLVYSIIRIDIPLTVIKVLFKGTEEERRVRSEKMEKFYYDKFNACTTGELKEIIKNFDEYQAEAQIALQKIKEEKSN